MRQSLNAQHWLEFELLKQGKAWRDVPLLPWAPVISREEEQMISTATERLHRSLLDVGYRELREGRVNHWLPDLKGLRQSVETDSMESPDFHWRYDFLWNRRSGELKFIEVNAGDPSGMGWVASFAKGMLRESFWSEVWGGKAEPSPLFESHEKALKERLNAQPDPVVRILSAESSTVASDILSLAELYQGRGWNVDVAEPRQLRIERDEVSVDGQRVHAVLRDTYEELFWPPYEEIGPKLLIASEAGVVKILNPLVASFWDSKSLWSLLDCDSGAAETVRLEDWIQAGSHQHEWVLKPSYDYGGRGVVCGFASSERDWSHALAEARASDGHWVMQRAFRVDCEVIPFLSTSRELKWAPRFLTWSAFINNGCCSGFMTRSSQLPVVNVHNGGAIFPVMVTL